ncbi:hypothetical protein HHUSO_G6622 [Huso huso]|uniref:Uncharacterized protein n=1 Tax=Huso huso TaxID=61971 RepID=A0ABR0ZY35_HUSHU
MNHIETVEILGRLQGFSGCYQFYVQQQHTDDALKDWGKKLDLLCFPDLYTHGIHGMHAEQTPRLNPTEFVKAQL